MFKAAYPNVQDKLDNGFKLKDKKNCQYLQRDNLIIAPFGIQDKEESLGFLEIQLETYKQDVTKEELYQALDKMRGV